MDRREAGVRLRAWGGASTTALAFPLAALVAALLAFATAELTAGLVAGLLLALVPWALLAGDIRLGGWTMAVAGVGIPAAVVLRYDATGATFLAMLAVAWLAAEGRSRAAEVVALAGAIAIPIADVASNSARYRGNAWVYLATGSLFSWFVGRILRRERELVGALTDARDRLRDAAAAAERQRIARDVHDVIGHSLTVVLLHIMGARRLMASDPSAAAHALDRAEKVGRDSLDSVRGVVGLLRGTDENRGAVAPAPGAVDIAALARSAAEGGLPIRVESEGDLLSVDPHAGLAAFRLVQEAISNVEHHAPGADVMVRVVNDGARLGVSVENGASPVPVPEAGARSPGGGTGLIGLCERITAAGGTMSAGPWDDGWRVEASIPLHRTSAESLR